MVEDPIFGWIAYGGNLYKTKKAFNVTPKDGMLCRFGIVTDELRLQMELNRDGFAKNEPIIVSNDFHEIEFVIENRSGKPHETYFKIIMVGEQKLECYLDGKQLQVLEKEWFFEAKMPISKNNHKIRLVRYD